MDRRPTQSDVAKLAGVHRATVSLAFKNHPSIPASTKQRVLQCAEKIGYSPDPMLSALAAYRSRNRPKAFQGTLAWLANNFREEFTWRDVTAYRDYHDGAAARAKSYGFKLEVFDLQEFAHCKKRLVSIFRARDIRGILLPPQLAPNVEIDFPWEEFSAVTFGHSLAKPRLHLVTAAQFRSTVQVMRQLKQLGYQRIGFYFNSMDNNKTGRNYLAAYLVESCAAEKSRKIPPLLYSFSKNHGEAFLRWYQEHRPDAIVTGDRNILRLLKSFDIQVPRHLGVASPLLERDLLEQNTRLAGMYEDSFHIGEVAMDFLVLMIQRGERGIPPRPLQLLVEGTWKMGDTLRRMPSEENARPFTHL